MLFNITIPGNTSPAAIDRIMDFIGQAWQQANPFLSSNINVEMVDRTVTFTESGCEDLKNIFIILMLDTSNFLIILLCVRFGLITVIF